MSTSIFDQRHTRALLSGVICLFVVIGCTAEDTPKPTHTTDVAPQAPVTVPAALDGENTDPAVVEAIEAACAQVRRAPESADAWGELGMSFMAHGYHVQAAECFTRAEQLDEFQPQWPYLLGVLEEDEDLANAAEAYQRAIDASPEADALARLRYGETLLQLGQPEQAREQFHLVLRRDEKNARARLGMGRAAFQLGNFDECIEHLQRCLGDPHCTQAATVLISNVRQRRGDIDVAATKRFLAAFSDRPWPDRFVDEVTQRQTGLKAALVEASRSIDQRNYEAAVDRLRPLADVYPQSHWVHIRLGQAHLGGQRFDIAEQSFHKAIELAPNCAEAHFNLGIVHSHSNNLEAAVAAFASAARMKPDFAMARYNQGFCLARLGRRAAAIEAYRAAIGSQPDLAAGYERLGHELAQSGELREAAVQLQHAVELAPHNDWAHRRLEEVKRQMKAME